MYGVTGNDLSLPANATLFSEARACDELNWANCDLPLAEDVDSTYVRGEAARRLRLPRMFGRPRRGGVDANTTSRLQPDPRTTLIRLAFALRCKVSALVTIFDKEDLAKLLPK